MELLKKRSFLRSEEQAIQEALERSYFAEILWLATCQNLPKEFVFPLCNGYFCHFSEKQLSIRKLLYQSYLSVFLLIPSVG